MPGALFFVPVFGPSVDRAVVRVLGGRVFGRPDAHALLLRVARQRVDPYLLFGSAHANVLARRLVAFRPAASQPVQKPHHRWCIPATDGAKTAADVI